MTPIAKRLLTALGVIALISPSARAQSDYDPALDGQWRGALEFPQGVKLTLGINIEAGELTLDSPNQGSYGMAPTEFSLKGNQVSARKKELKASFTGQLEEGKLKGTLTQGTSVPITLYKLNAEDKQRLEFEGRYTGDLVIDKTAKLPLVLNVAVLPEGYLGTLDSPAQQSYTIPLTDMRIDAQQLSFDSPMINASYRGEFTKGAYEGTFSQGMARPLTLKKADGSEESVSVPKPQAGDNGGARAVITRDQVQTHYWADHTAQTRYEIGSNTKTMVAYLLAKALLEGRVGPATSLADIWPEAPGDITLEQLASHHSGLPRLPANLGLDQSSFADPYAGYDRRLLREALAAVSPGEKRYLYSNFGFGVLGEALAESSDTTFSELLSAQLLEPLGMRQTTVAINPAQDHPELAQGYDLQGKPVSAWHFDAMAGAGAVVSTLPDMIAYVQTMMRQSAKGDDIVRTMLDPQNVLGPCCTEPLGWMLGEDEQGRPYAWHAGQTAGFTSVIGFYLDGSRGMVLLNNQMIEAEEASLDILTGSTPTPTIEH